MRNRILVIDDDKEFLDEIKETLTLNDYDVVVENNPSLALERAMQLRPDLILLDLAMPEESGLQVACEIKYFSKLRHIPIIAITGHLSDHYKSILNNYGMLNYLIKPIDPVNLILHIERVL